MPKFSPELFDEICVEIADGKSLRTICKREDMPNLKTVMRWLREEDNESLRQQYARAREDQADALFEDCLDIADTFDSKEMVEPQHINRAKLRIDTRKWMAGKLRPKKYGDKLELENKHSTADDLTDLLDSVAKNARRIGVN
jgi:hypothetical protein